MKRIRFSALLLIACTTGLYAQTPTDAITMVKGDVCFVSTYDHATWDKYWEGTLVRENGNVGTFTRNSIHVGFAWGIIDRLNFIADVPYISTKSDGGQLAGVHGLQDVSIALKGLLLERRAGKGVLYTLGTAGFSTRMTNYLSDYQPYSLGLGTTQFSLRGIVQYKFDMGLYLRGMGAYIWRGTTEAERDYYYNGGSYYTAEMDVPNAWHYQAVSGVWLLQDALKLEVNYNNIVSVSGDDIRPWNAGQPTNKGIMHALGGSIQYYVPQVPGLSVLGYYSNVIDGRNTGDLTTIGGGLTYIISIYSHQNTPVE